MEDSEAVEVIWVVVWAVVVWVAWEAVGAVWVVVWVVGVVWVVWVVGLEARWEMHAWLQDSTSEGEDALGATLEEAAMSEVMA